MAVPRQASLRRLILSSLLRQPAPTVSALARDLNASRPAVSRAVNGLAGLGLLQHDSSWHLTSAGQLEARRIVADIPQVISRAATVATRSISQTARLTFEPELLRAADSFLVAFEPQLMRAADSFRITSAPTLDSLVGAFAQFDTSALTAKFALSMPQFDTSALTAKFALSMPQFDTSALFSRLGMEAATAIRAAVDMHSLYIDATRLAQTSVDPWAASVAQSMAATEETLADMAAIASTVSSRESTPAADVRHAARSSAKIVTGLRNMVPSLVADLAEMTPVRGSPANRLKLSSSATARYVSGARQVVDSARAPDAFAPATYPDPSTILHQIDPQLAGIRAGAWHAATSGGPDWHRHTSQSARELLRQLLTRLAPDEAVADRFGATTRRNRVRFVVEPFSPTESAWAERLAESIITTLDFLSAEAKTDSEPRFTRAAALGILLSLDGLAVFLIETSRPNPGALPEVQ